MSLEADGQSPQCLLPGAGYEYFVYVRHDTNLRISEAYDLSLTTLLTMSVQAQAGVDRELTIRYREILPY